MKDLIQGQIAIVEAGVAKLPQQEQDAYFRLKRELAAIAAAHSDVSDRVLVVLGLNVVLARLK